MKFLLKALLLGIIVPTLGMAGFFNPKVGALENGLKFAVTENHRAPVVCFIVWYKVGAADDPVGASGMAHFLEHLMFEGVPGLKSGEYDQILRGLGGEYNAATSSDYTYYYVIVAKEHLETVMALEARRMAGIALTREQVDKERQVILEERSSHLDDNPEALATEATFPMLFWHHPYGKPIIGWENEIKNISLASLLAFHQRWYGPENAVITLSGDITYKEAENFINKHFGGLPRRFSPLRQRLQEPPHHGAKTALTYKDKRVKHPLRRRYYQGPNLRSASRLTCNSLSLLTYLLTGSSTSYLYRSLVEDRKLALAVSFFYDEESYDPSFLALSFTPQEGVTLDQLEAAIDEELQNFLKKGISKDTLEAYKKRFLSGLIYKKDALALAAFYVGSVLVQDLSVEETIENIEKQISRIDVQSIMKAAKSLVEAKEVTTLTLMPESGQ